MRLFIIYTQIALTAVLSGLHLSAVAANQTTNIFDQLQPGHWYEVPNSNLRQICPEANSQGHGYNWAFHCASVMNAWSGGAYDSKRDRLIVWGGGHGDYAGNEVYAFDLATLSWQMVTQPSTLSEGCDGYGWNGECSSGEEMPDQRPVSRHTYDSLEYLPESDLVWASGGSRWSSGFISEAAWTLNLENNEWSRGEDRPETSWYYTNVTAYDPVTQNIFNFGQDSLMMHNPVTGEWTELTVGETPLSDGVTAELDPERRLLVVIGDGVAIYYDLRDLQAVTRHELVSTGDNSIINTKAPGLVYDKQRKSLIAWSGEPDKGVLPEDIYELDLDTFEWKKHSPAETNTVIPTRSAVQGTYGRFRYIPSQDAFIVVNDVDQNVFLYKLSHHVQGVDVDVLSRQDIVSDAAQASATVQDQNAIDSLPAGYWYEVPESDLRQHCLADNAQGHGYDWSFYCAGIMNAWSGGAYDSKRERLMIWGGGHGDYAGNEIYGFDVNTLSWINITQPSDLSDGCDGFGWNGECPSGEDMPDGQPVSRHTYDSIEYLPEQDIFWASGGARWPTGALADATWHLNLEDNTWIRKTDRPEKSWYYTHFSAYDPVTKNVFSFGQDSLLMHNPATDQWTELTHGETPMSDGMTAELDPQRRILVVIGDGLAYYYDLTDLQNVVRKELVASGDSQIVQAKAPGLIYNSEDQTMVAWAGDPQKGLQPEDIYILDLDEFKWAKRVPAEGNTVIPTKAAQQGTYGRFKYVASKNALIVVNDVDQNVYFYKLSSNNNPDSNQSSDKKDDDPVAPANPIDPVESNEPTHSDHPIGVNDQDEYGADISQNDTVRVFTETFGQGELPVLTVMEALPAHISGVEFNNELVSVGVPLQQGAGVHSVDQLELAGASGAQFKALSYYPNGEIRWLHIDFLASVSAGGQSRYELINSHRPWSGNSLAQQSGGIINIDTGSAQFTVDQDSSSLMTSVIVDGQQQLSDAMFVYSVKNGQEYTSLNDDSTQVTIEKNGPVTAVIRVDGRLYNAQGNGHFWYTARLHFVRNSADVRTQVTIRNASQQELDTQIFDAYGVRMIMANDRPAVSFVTEDGSTWQDTLQGNETALIYQGFVDNHPFNQAEISNCYYWTPTVAGVCDSSYVYNYQTSNKGVRVVMAGNTLLQGGNAHSVAYAHVESGGQSISLAQRWMANHFPASFEIDANGQIDIGLHSRFSGKNNQQFNWGGHQTREFVIGFQQAEPGVMRHKLDWPLVARADFDYYRHANALLGENKMISYSEEESYFDKYNGFEPDSIKSSSTASFKVKRFTHWRRHYTDYLADIVEFWRGGDPMYLLRVLQSTDFETDAAIAHSDGFDLEHFPNLNVPYAEQRGLNKYDSEHQLTRYLPLVYFMTGSERVRQAIIDYGEDQLFDDRAYYFPFPETPYHRAWLRRFENFAWLYGFTRDERYLEEVKSGIDLLVDSEARDGQRETRGQDKQRGFLNMSVAEGYEERVIHNFFGVQISGETYYQVMRTLQQSGIDYRTDDLEDVVLGHAYFLFRELMRNQDGSSNGISYTYYLDRENQVSGFDNSVYVADRYLQHIYDMFGVDYLDGMDLFAQAFDLNYVRGTSVYLPGMMANGQQQALMYNDLFRPAPKHGYQSIDVRVDKNDNGTYTLTWKVPEGAERYRVKASKNKPIVDWLGFDQSTRSYKLSSEAFVPWFAAQNLDNEPEPGIPGSLQTWTVSDLPNDGYWYFNLQYSTRQNESGIM